MTIQKSIDMRVRDESIVLECDILGVIYDGHHSLKVYKVSLIYSWE